MGINGASAIVTGGGQGIGSAIARELASMGVRVLVSDIDEGALGETVSCITAMGFECVGHCGDIADEDSVKGMVDEAVRAFGGVDILVNNAAIGIGGSLEDLAVAEWDRVIAVNLRGPFMASKYCAPVMKARGSGNIVNIASTRALMSEPDTFPYSASKGGLLALTHSLAVSLGPFGIRVNSISPGWIETAHWQKASRRSVPKHTDADRNQHPVGRVGHPGDIAKAVRFLCSPDAGFVTGSNLVVDGGMTVKMIYV